MPYYLSDSIYPKWARLIQSVAFPNGEKETNFAKQQEAARRDVERVFVILQARWSIIKQPSQVV